MDEKRFKKRTIFLIAYLVFALLPIYWMVNMSFKTNAEILGSFNPAGILTKHVDRQTLERHLLTLGVVQDYGRAAFAPTTVGA